MTQPTPCYHCALPVPAGNRFTGRLSLLPDLHPVEALKDYQFGDPTIVLPKEPKDVIDEELDAQGKLRTELALPEEAGKPTAPVAPASTGDASQPRPFSKMPNSTTRSATRLPSSDSRSMGFPTTGQPWSVAHARFPTNSLAASSFSNPSSSLRSILSRTREPAGTPVVSGISKMAATVLWEALTTPVTLLKGA